tara:strand:+ start:190 stop:1143 length:954 start_codon:yes stop_codon:yes gene_type:complete
MAQERNLYSIVIPVLNITDSLVELHKRIESIMSQNDFDYELIFIDDGSTNEKTLETMKNIQNNSSTDISIISFFSNSGQQAAILAGMQNAKGNYLITMDGDLEHRPEDLLSLIDTIKNGNYDVVFGNFKTKTHNIVKRFFSSLYTAIEKRILDYPEGTKRSAFWIMKSEVANEILKFNTLNPNISILVTRITKKIGTAIVTQGKREEGGSAYTWSRMFMLASALFINNTAILLRIYAVLGGIVVLASICLGSYLLYIDFTQHHPIYSRKFLFVSILFFGGVIMIGISIVGEYIARIMQNVERKPLYSIRKIYKKNSD